MVRVTFVEPDGTAREVLAPCGRSLMEVGVSNRLVGLLAECGGACACATCHVYVDEAWRSRLSPPSDFEAAMVGEALEARDNSRLSCQIRVTEDLDGLVVRLPERQV